MSNHLVRTSDLPRLPRKGEKVSDVQKEALAEMGLLSGLKGLFRRAPKMPKAPSQSQFKYNAPQLTSKVRRTRKILDPNFKPYKPGSFQTDRRGKVRMDWSHKALESNRATLDEMNARHARLVKRFGGEESLNKYVAPVGQTERQIRNTQRALWKKDPQTWYRRTKGLKGNQKLPGNWKEEWSAHVSKQNKAWQQADIENQQHRMAHPAPKRKRRTTASTRYVKTRRIRVLR